MRHNISPIGRRDLLGVAITAFIVPVSWRPAGGPNHGRVFVFLGP